MCEPLEGRWSVGSGLDNIDLEAAEHANVEVVSATGANAVAVAEYVMSALLHLRRPMTTGFQAMVCGDWPRTIYRWRNFRKDPRSCGFRSHRSNCCSPGNRVRYAGGVL